MGSANSVLSNGWLAFFSFVFTISAIAGAVWNFIKPKHYGFLLSLNSGDKKLFTTSDVDGLKQVISVIYDFIETEQDSTYQITVNNSKIRGNFIQGAVGGNVVYDSND
jgi:hypothetical protein